MGLSILYSRDKVKGGKMTKRPKQVKWFGKIYNVPDSDILHQLWLVELSLTPEGEEVPFNHPESWLTILGLI
jgi:hypothetical protein